MYPSGKVFQGNILSSSWGLITGKGSMELPGVWKYIGSIVDNQFDGEGQLIYELPINDIKSIVLYLNECINYDGM